MKALKISAIVVGGVVVLLAIVVALAFTSSVQTWAVRKAVAGQPGMTIEVSRVAAGLSAADISDFRFTKDGMIVTAKSVSARYSASDYIKHKRINADSVTVDELVVDLRNAKPAPAAAPAGPATKAGEKPAAPAKPAAEKASPFEGLLKEAQLPFDVRLGALAVKGRALLPNNQVVTFELKGGGIDTGQRGTLEWTVDFADSTAGADLRAARSIGKLGLRIAADRRIDLVELETTASAMGPKIPNDQVRVSAKAERPATGGNESYNSTISLVRGGNVEPLLKTASQFLAASREIAGTWELAIRSEQLATLLSGFGLPEVAANGTGKFSVKPDTGAAAASGNLLARASQLQKISADLAPIGSVELKVSFDGAMADNVARLDQLVLDVAAADGRKFAEIRALQKITFALADKRVTLADPKAELARVSLKDIPLAWAQSFAKPRAIESGDLSMVLAVEAEPDGSRIRVRSAEPLALRNVTVREGDKKLVDRLTLTVRPTIDYSATRVIAQLAELTVTMPAGDSVTGNVTADVTNLATSPATAFTAKIQAKIVSLLKPFLPVDTGPLSIATTIEGRHEGQTLQLAKATTIVNRENGTLLASIELQQAVKADLKTSTFAFANPTATAARVQLGEIPLAWAEGFVAKSKFAGTFSGATLELAMRSVDDLNVSTTAPLAFQGVAATMDGKAMVQGLNLTTDFSASKKGETVGYEVRKLELKQGDLPLMSLAVSGQAKLGAKLTVAAKGNLDADVAALMKQPALAANATLARGRITAAFDATMADAIQANAVITGRNLVAKVDNRPLGDLDVKLVANVKPDGSGTLTLPLTLANGDRKSDLSIDGAFGKAANKTTFLFTGKIVSNQLLVDDFQPLAGLAPASEAPKPATPAPRTPAPSAPTRDTVPFWNGVNGKVEVDLKRIVYGKDYVISGVRGTAVITDSKLSLDGLEGKFKENPFKVMAGVNFAANQPKPYTMTGSADVEKFDVGAFLKASSPDEQPALETRATLSAKLNGTGGTVAELGKNAFGKFELTGTQGTMRVLARKGQAGAAVDLLATGLAIFGAQKNSATTSSLAEITRLLKEVPFDSIKLQVERGADLNFKLTSMEVLSPILRLTGSGTVESKDTTIDKAPMNILLQLGAKNELGYLLQRSNLLGQKQDEKGYTLMSRTFSVGGTPSKPDNSSLWKILGEAALGGVLGR
ncbi:AsmA family protein [Horticoccus sp. 23ND18S-11]|uniref:hypothetical protein n=1 Tax=Horticoccus sp. 23ND18S-11 TaxID=3391832 RepID=UPI0039C9E1FD